MFRKYLIILVGVLSWSLVSRGAIPAEMVPENPNARCEGKTFGTEVRFFKFSRISQDQPDESYDDLLVTTLKGNVTIKIAGDPRPVGKLGLLVKQHDEGNPRYRSSASAWHDNYVMAVPIFICPPSQGYDWSPGLILVSEMEAAEMAAKVRDNQGMPPSTRANPIPQRVDAKVEVTTPLF